MKVLIVFAIVLTTISATSLNSKTKNSELVQAEVLPEGRITNGQNANAGNFPYQVGLLLKRPDNKYLWCGGSLIHNEWVLTAAHCTEGIVEVTIYLGSIIRMSAEVEHTVTKKNIIIHKDWSLNTLRNDISLIKIPYTKYSSNIRRVELPTSKSSFAAEYVIASGWGDISDIKSGGSKYLQWARMRVITNSACSRYYGISSSHICIATTGGVATCNGDSGGPLILENSNVLVGVTSFGAFIGCTKGIPDVFTRVSSYLDWIRTHTGISN